MGKILSKIPDPCKNCGRLMDDGNCQYAPRCLRYIAVLDERQKLLRELFLNPKPGKKKKREFFTYYHPDEGRDLRRKADENRAESKI